MTDNDTRVLELLQQRYDDTNPHFLWSDNFVRLIDNSTKKITSDPANKFVHIQHLVDDSKTYKATPLKHLLRGNDKPSASPGDELLSKRARLDDSTAEIKRCKLIPLSDISDKSLMDIDKPLDGANDCCVIDDIDVAGASPQQSDVADDWVSDGSNGAVLASNDVDLDSSLVVAHGSKVTDGSSKDFNNDASKSPAHVSPTPVRRLEKLLKVTFLNLLVIILELEIE